jgi:hypothetical protein
MTSYPFRKIGFVAIALVMGVIWPRFGSAQANPKTFPLIVMVSDDVCGLAPVWPDPSLICSDGENPYVDQAEGRSTPDVYSTRGGSVEMDLNGSTRTLRLIFTEGVSPDPVRPKSSSSPVLLRTLARSDIGGVTQLPRGAEADFSMSIFWTAIGVDNKTHSYAIDLDRQSGSGIHVVAAADGNSWTITPIGPARVSVHLKSGKTGYWNVIGDYSITFTLVATRL